MTEALLLAVRSGDRDAINPLLERHRGPIHRLVEMRLDRKVQRRVDVSDVVQEVLMEANGRLDRYLDESAMPFHLWLRQIAWDRIIDTYRRHRVSAKRNMDREIILMRHYEHLTNQEIADVLGLKPPATSMRYLRAIRRLRELMEEPEQRPSPSRH